MNFPPKPSNGEDAPLALVVGKKGSDSGHEEDQGSASASSASPQRRPYRSVISALRLAMIHHAEENFPELTLITEFDPTSSST